MNDTSFKIFAVEDDPFFRELIVYQLEMDPEHVVKSFETASACIESLHEKPDLITLDYKLPDMTGLEALKAIKERYPDVDVVIISEQENIETAVELVREGAFDYIVKSRDNEERLRAVVRNAKQQASLKKEVKHLRKEVGKKYTLDTAIIGQSPAIQRVFSLIEKTVKTNITVSVFGETGTGKELVAKAIHFNSSRKDQPFVALNVAAIPSELMESELFGHEKGAFTSADYRRIGKFEEASGGTLFLDEIGEMDLSMQVKLLRALQEKEIVRVGSNKPIKIDSRIIVATHRNLREEVKEGRFREDLYYRLFGLPIELPPLRDRGKDIVILAKHFLESFVNDNGLEVNSFTQEAQRKLMAYPYPGNVRELKAVVELAAVMTNTDQIDEDCISFGTVDMLPDLVTEELTMREYTMRIIDHYLDRYDNNIKLVSEKLDIGQSTLYRMLKERREGDTTSTTI
ncbi:MAG: sigma-54-dependent transcriptional regulator [Bacteroidia bacterium]